jgi:RimJ/RimL family protein N-acetyltransferase
LKYLESFDKSSNLFFAITLNQTNEFVGTITAYISDFDGTADIGIMIGEVRHWGKGLGLDSWKTLMDFLLIEQNIRKVTGGTLSCNIGMISIMKSSGMELEAVKKKQQIIDGLEQDELYFSKFR